MNIYQYAQTTNQTRTSSSSTSSNLSNQAVILELSGNEQMEMENYQPYSVNSVQTTYVTAASTSLDPYEVYESWLTELGPLLDQRLTDSYSAIDLQKGKTDGLLTEEFKNELSNDQLIWFEQQIENLRNQLTTSTSLTSGELNDFILQPINLLGKMDLSMLNVINQYMSSSEKTNVSFSSTLTAYRDFEESFSQEIADYLSPITAEINNRSSSITNDEIEDYLEKFNQWANEIKENLLLNFTQAQAPFDTMLVEDVENTIDLVIPGVRNIINVEIQQKNSEIENANRRRQQAAEAEQLNKLKIDYKTGSDTNEISISTSKPSSSKYSTKFVVEGSAGKNKDIYISFSDERMKKEFDKRIKAAGLEGKKLSAKEFNEILKELKSSLKDLGEIDLDALLRKMEKGEKNLDFEHSMNRFILYLKRAVKA